MTEDKAPNRSAKQGTRSQLEVVVPVVAKAASDLSGIPYLGPLVGALSDLVKEHISRTRDAMRQETDQRLAAFYDELLHAGPNMDEQVARAMVDDKDFHALLRACVADIEAEKVRAYANLARGIACGSVAEGWRRHFILSLRDLSADELGCLRGALVASENQLIPAHMVVGSVGQDHFLREGEPGTPQAIWMNSLSGRGFVHKGQLSKAGKAFARACYSPNDLTPAALGYRTWSGHKVAIVCYELGDRTLDGVWGSLQDGLRDAGVQSTVLAIVRENEEEARLHFTMGLLLIRARTKGLDDNLPHLAKFTKTIPTALVDVGGSAGELAGVALFAQVAASSMNPAGIVDAVRRRVIEKSREMAAAHSSQ